MTLQLLFKSIVNQATKQQMVLVVAFSQHISSEVDNIIVWSADKGLLSKNMMNPTKIVILYSRDPDVSMMEFTNANILIQHRQQITSILRHIGPQGTNKFITNDQRYYGDMLDDMKIKGVQSHYQGNEDLVNLQMFAEKYVNELPQDMFKKTNLATITDLGSVYLEHELIEHSFGGDLSAYHKYCYSNTLFRNRAFE